MLDRWGTSSLKLDRQNQDEPKELPPFILNNINVSMGYVNVIGFKTELRLKKYMYR